MDKNNHNVTEHIERMLQQIRFGSITLVIQDGKIIQIERYEKIRIK